MRACEHSLRSRFGDDLLVEPSHGVDSERGEIEVDRLYPEVAHGAHVVDDLGVAAGEQESLAFRVHRHGASAPAKADNGERFLFSGSNAEIIDDLRAMRELGVKAIDFNFAALTVDAMRRFHEEVVAKS